MFLIKSISFLVLICFILGSVSPVQAQESATIQALASVVTTLSIIGTSALQFGQVSPGVNKSVDKTQIGDAGEWSITGIASDEISLIFTLPDSLLHASGIIGMPITFVFSDASFDDGTGSQAAPTGVLDPNAYNAERIGVGGTMSVWIGGTVLPRIGQAGGNYSSDVMLTVTYTGS